MLYNGIEFPVTTYVSFGTRRWANTDLYRAEKRRTIPFPVQNYRCNILVSWPAMVHQMRKYASLHVEVVWREWLQTFVDNEVWVSLSRLELSQVDRFCQRRVTPFQTTSMRNKTIAMKLFERPQFHEYHADDAEDFELRSLQQNWPRVEQARGNNSIIVHIIHNDLVRTIEESAQDEIHNTARALVYLWKKICPSEDTNSLPLSVKAVSFNSKLWYHNPCVI